MAADDRPPPTTPPILTTADEDCPRPRPTPTITTTADDDRPRPPLPPTTTTALDDRPPPTTPPTTTTAADDFLLPTTPPITATADDDRPRPLPPPPTTTADDDRLPPTTTTTTAADDRPPRTTPTTTTAADDRLLRPPPTRTTAADNCLPPPTTTTTADDRPTTLPTTTTAVNEPPHTPTTAADDCPPTTTLDDDIRHSLASNGLDFNHSAAGKLPSSYVESRKKKGATMASMSEVDHRPSDAMVISMLLCFSHKRTQHFFEQGIYLLHAFALEVNMNFTEFVCVRAWRVVRSKTGTITVSYRRLSECLSALDSQKESKYHQASATMEYFYEKMSEDKLLLPYHCDEVFGEDFVTTKRKFPPSMFLNCFISFLTFPFQHCFLYNLQVNLIEKPNHKKNTRNYHQMLLLLLLGSRTSR
jgi:hypothetical protein